MYLDNLFGTGNTISPYQGPSSRAASVNAGNGANTYSRASANVPTSIGSANANSDQVSLSSAAQALQAQAAVPTSTQPGATTDFSQEQQLLTTLTDKSLAALGIISPADEANTQISFNSLAYQVSSSATASVSQQGQQTTIGLGSEQDASFVGQGTIVTPDGTHYTFQVSLELDQSEQAASTVGSTDSTSDTSDAGSNSSSGSSVGNQLQSLPSNLLAQLVNAMGLSSPSSTAPAANTNSPQNLQNNPFAAIANDVTSTPSASAATPSTGINWDAILKQTASLFDILDSLATPAQAASAAPSQTPATATA